MLIECNSMRSLIKSANWSRSVLMGMLKELRFNCAMMEDYGTWIMGYGRRQKLILQR